MKIIVMTNKTYYQRFNFVDKLVQYYVQGSISRYRLVNGITKFLDNKPVLIPEVDIEAAVSRVIEDMFGDMEEDEDMRVRIKNAIEIGLYGR